MLTTAARLLRLLTMLQDGKTHSAQELAQDAGTTPRTIRRDIDRLRGLGYPIGSVLGAAGGYRFGPEGPLPPLLLDGDEAVAVVLGLRAMTSGAIAGAGEAGVSALAKVERLLPSRLRYRVDVLHESTVHVPVGTTEIGSDVVIALAAACREHEFLRFRYSPRGREAGSRHVQPYRLVHLGRRWYLLARDVDRDEWRTFRVDRLSTPQPTGRRFTLTDAPDPVTFVAEAVSTGPYRYVARIVLHAPATDMIDLIPATIGAIEPIDDHCCRLVAGADDLDDIARHLCLLDCDFHVEAPADLRNAVARVSERLVAACRQSGCELSSGG